MSDREIKLWEILDRFLAIIAIFIILVLSAIYFYIGFLIPGEDFNSILRTYFQNLISNIIPTFILFIGAYFILRRLNLIKQERDNEKLAEMILERMQNARTLQDSANKQTSKTPRDPDDELKFGVRNQFDITNRQFEDSTNPQKIKFEFTNYNTNILRINRIKFSSQSIKFSNQYLLNSYRKTDNGISVIIPFDENKKEVQPGDIFAVELGLSARFDSKSILALAGNIGFLEFDVTYLEKNFELLYMV